LIQRTQPIKKEGNCIRQRKSKGAGNCDRLQGGKMKKSDAVQGDIGTEKLQGRGK